jgi:hypothetical protein
VCTLRLPDYALTIYLSLKLASLISRLQSVLKNETDLMITDWIGRETWSNKWSTRGEKRGNVHFLLRLFTCRRCTKQRAGIMIVEKPADKLTWSSTLRKSSCEHIDSDSFGWKVAFKSTVKSCPFYVFSTR